MHYKAQTLIGPVVCTINELINFIKIGILETADYILSDEDFSLLDEENKEKIIKTNKEHNFLRPTQNLTVLPEELQIPENFKRTKINGVIFGYHKIDDEALLRAELFCRHCGNQQNHSHCSPNGKCVYMEKLKSLDTKDPRFNSALNYLTSGNAIMNARNKENCFIPVERWGKTKNQITYKDAYWYISVNGKMVDPFNGFVPTKKAISNLMVCPWNNPFIDDYERWFWSKFFEAKKFYNTKFNNAQYFLSKSELFKERGKNRIPSIFLKWMKKELTEFQKQSLLEFCSKEHFYSEPVLKPAKYSGYINTIPSMPASIIG